MFQSKSWSSYILSGAHKYTQGWASKGSSRSNETCNSTRKTIQSPLAARQLPYLTKFWFGLKLKKIKIHRGGN